jgi:hypothetical protein
MAARRVDNLPRRGLCNGRQWGGAGRQRQPRASQRFEPPWLGSAFQKSMLAEASTVRGEPKCASRLPVLAPVRLLGATVDQ